MASGDKCASFLVRYHTYRARWHRVGHRDSHLQWQSKAVLSSVQHMRSEHTAPGSFRSRTKCFPGQPVLTLVKQWCIHLYFRPQISPQCHYIGHLGFTSSLTWYFTAFLPWLYVLKAFYSVKCFLFEPHLSFLYRGGLGQNLIDPSSIVFYTETLGK